jgi:hypothetical protein
MIKTSFKHKSMNENSAKIVEIYSGTLWEAAMIKNLLKDSEIKSFVRNSIHNTYACDPIMACGVKVMIFESDAPRAREIVDNHYNNMKVDL